MSVNFSGIIDNFLTAEVGEDVRGSLVEIARALEAAINSQLNTVTGDFANTDPNTAILVSAIANILFGGSDQTGKTPFVLNYWTHSQGTQFSVADMPRNSFTNCVASEFAQKPENVENDSGVVIWRNAANVAGNVSELILFDRTQYRLYYSMHIETYDTVAWKEIATKDELVNYWPPPASGTQFSVSDMPRRSYTYTLASAFAQKPEKIPNSDSISIWREPANSAGNVSRLECFDRTADRFYIADFAENIPTINWNEISYVENSIEKSGITITAENKLDYFTDANDAPNNSIFRILDTAEIKNTPWGNGYSTGAGNYNGTVRSVTGYLSGTLLTYGSTDAYRNQIFISGNDISSNPQKITVMYFRSRFGPTAGWSDWHMLSDRAAITGSNVVIRKKLIAPFETSDGTPTATDTGIANHQRIVGDPFYFNDFDNAPLNSIIQVDLDCDATVMSNNPLSGKSNILMTWCWSYVRRHAIVQFCLGLSSGTSTEFYYRYGYENSPTQFIWTPWESARATTDKALEKEDRAADAKAVRDMFGKTPVMKGVLESGDVQSIDGNGFYALSGSNTYTHLPSWAGDTNAKRAGYIQQVELNSASKILIYYHKTLGIGTCVCTGGTWGDWIRIPAAYVPFPTTAEAGNVLAVNDDGEYFNVAFQTLLGLFLPQPTQADAGKILKVDSNGKYVLAAP